MVVLTPVRLAFYSLHLTALLPLVVAMFVQDDRIYPTPGSCCWCIWRSLSHWR